MNRRNWEVEIEFRVVSCDCFLQLFLSFIILTIIICNRVAVVVWVLKGLHCGMCHPVLLIGAIAVCLVLKTYHQYILYFINFSFFRSKLFLYKY